MLATQHYTPLRWWSTADLADLSRSLDSAVNGWSAGWFADAHESFPSSRCKLAHEARECADVEWRLLGTSSGAAAWIFVPVGALDDMRSSLFEGESGPIATNIAQTACVEYEEALRTFLHLFPGATCETPPVGMSRPWDGAVFAELSRPGEQRCLLLMNAECVTRLMGAQVLPKAIAVQRNELISCESALSQTKASLRVELVPCELEIGNLAALQIGDVIPWPHALEHPLQLCMEDGARICSGHLGRAGSFKAVELLPRERDDS